VQGKLSDKIRLQHIFDAILEIEEYISNSEFQDFMLNSMMRFACIKQMEFIGEASNHISEEITSKFTKVQWAQIIGMRNVFVHEYFGVDSILVWQIIKNRIQEIIDSVERL
jgi:uncharacterized protein with HEPN domain